MREKRWYPVIYMFGLTALFSSVVIGFAQVTRQRVEANKELDFERAVVNVLPQLYEANLSASDVHRKFTERVTGPDAAAGGACVLIEGGQVKGYALPVSGQGFWAPIKAVIGIEADMKTVTGVAVYEQSETPGLGAEITAAAFQDQFRGKVLASGDRPIRIRRPGDALGPSDVHAVTGATQTSTRFERVINDAVKAWREEMARKGERQ